MSDPEKCISRPLGGGDDPLAQGNSPKTRLQTSLIALGLVAMTLIAYRQVGTFSFIFFDDNEYVTLNPVVTAGLTKAGLAWAFSEPHLSNWHPLTWLSHMADIDLFGLDSGAHHLVNLAFHAANAVLLFLVLGRMTGDPWRSGFVAALFALHPLHVESVAWVSERKDVLSTFFWLWTLWAYAAYAERGGPWRYMTVVLLFAAGLLSKSMLVTLPFVLLLLDFWPLRRTRFGPDDSATAAAADPLPPGRLLLEKAPLFLMSALFSAIAFHAQERGGSVSGFPPGERIANALLSYVAYLRKTAWPDDLALFYPHPSIGGRLAYLPVAGALLALAAITCLAVRHARQRPWLFTGWFWYLGTLVPVIGLVQIGRQAMADRYTYVPLTGIFIAIAWSVPGRFPVRRGGKALLAGAAGVVLLALATATTLQASFWRNSQAVFGHAIAVNPENWLANDVLGTLLVNEKRYDESERFLLEALRINPGLEDAWNNLGIVSLRKGRFDEAAMRFSRSLEIAPTGGIAHLNLGNLLMMSGNREQAISHYLLAIRAIPDQPEARFNLAVALDEGGRLDDAVARYREALALHPDYAAAHNNLGNALIRKGRIDEAVAHFREALRIDPADPIARENLEKAARGAPPGR